MAVVDVRAIPAGPWPMHDTVDELPPGAGWDDQGGSLPSVEDDIPAIDIDEWPTGWPRERRSSTGASR